MAKINSETLLRGDYLLPQKCNIELESGSLTTWLLVPLPLPTPGSAPVKCHQIQPFSIYFQKIF